MNAPFRPKQVIVVRKDLNMRKGKIASQVAHAAMMFLVKGAKFSPLPDGTWEMRQVVTEAAFHWLTGSFTKITPAAQDEAELRALVEKARAAGIPVLEVIDNGHTEFHGVPTLTCAAFGPAAPEALDPITGHLPLL